MVMQHVVVDGSNIATEGRTMPSLHQLDEAVTAFLQEHQAVGLTVVVDATFGHRIADNEKAEYEEAIINGELVTPPAGAIGRGDAFVLQIADKANASVFSNDSFQEFHGSYDWLFDEGRLIGGKPVPHVGWVFVLRTPVRGPLSRRSTRDARGSAKAADTGVRSTASKTTKAAKSTRATATKAVRSRAGGTAKRSDGTQLKTSTAARKVSAPITDAVQAEAVGEGQRSGRSRRRRGGAKALESVNDPIPFLEFVGNHPVGSEVQGQVDRFSSHGAYVVIDGAQCYIPLKAMGDPPPTSAREALDVGEVRSFVVQSFDSPRRGIDLALSGVAISPDEPLPPDHDIQQDIPAQEASSMVLGRKTAAKKLASKKSSPAKKSAAGRTLAKKSTAKKSTAKKSTAKKAPAKKSTAKRSTAKKSTAKKSTAKKAPAKKSTAKKSTAKKSAAAKKLASKKSTGKSAAGRTLAKKR